MSTLYLLSLIFAKIRGAVGFPGAATVESGQRVRAVLDECERPSLKLYIGLIEDFILEEKKNHFLNILFCQNRNNKHGIVFHYASVFVE